MNRIAAEIAIEVVMRFEQCDGDPRPGEQQRQDHSGRTAPNDAACGVRSHGSLLTAIRVRDSQRTGKFTELAMKHK